MEKQLEKLVDSTLPEVRGKVYELAKQRGYSVPYTTMRLPSLRSSRFGDDAPVVHPAVEYALWVVLRYARPGKTAPQSPQSACGKERSVGDDGDHPEAAEPLITQEWIADAAASNDRNRRIMAAIAVAVRGAIPESKCS